MTAIGVVAHLSRQVQAVDLAETVRADYTGWDDGTLGATGNHRKVWSWLAGTTAEWCVVLEDDAQPVTHFSEHVGAALSAAPTSVVSLYLGTGYPRHWQRKIAQAAAAADRERAAWIVSTHLLHAVGVAIRTDLVPDMLAHTETLSLPIDEAITAWAQTRGHLVAYTWPSLLDHRDEATLLAHPDGARRTRPRRAWRHGTPVEWRRTVDLAY